MLTRSPKRSQTGWCFLRALRALVPVLIPSETRYVGQAACDLAHLFEVVEQQTGRVPRAAGERFACAGGDGRLIVSSRDVDGLRCDTLTLNSACGFASTADNSASASCAPTVRHGMPRATELPKKISENDSPTTARMPQRCSAWGACSREEPQPKLPLTSRMRAPRTADSRTHASARALPAACRSSSNACVSRPSKLTHFRNRAGIMRSVSMSWPRSGMARPAILVDEAGVSPSRVHLFEVAASFARPRLRRRSAAAATMAGLISKRAAGRAALASLEVAVRR